MTIGRAGALIVMISAGRESVGLPDVSLLDLLAQAGIEAPSIVGMLAESDGPLGPDDFGLLDALVAAGVDLA